MKVKVFSSKGRYLHKLSRLTSQIKQSSCGGSLEVEKLFVSVWYKED